MKRSPKKHLTVEEMEKLPTKRLLNYRRLLMASQRPVHDDYCWDCDCDFCMDEKERWYGLRKHIKDAKDILDKREHVPR